MFDTVRLRKLLRAMLLKLDGPSPEERLLPSEAAVAEIGDFAANQARLRQILAEQLSGGR